MRLPAPQGPISSELFRRLRSTPDTNRLGLSEISISSDGIQNSLTNEDVQISVFACYGLHYRGFEDVDERWEWQPPVLAIRARLEEAFERDILAGLPLLDAVSANRLPAYLMDVSAPGGPASRPEYMHKRATLEQFRELVTHRSIDNLHEGDAHSWAIPRIGGRSKSALVEIQADEYGGGMPPTRSQPWRHRVRPLPAR